MEHDAILQGLNAAQQAAVKAEVPVLQILAPPGSGKTKTLTSRVAYLLAHFGYRPWNMLLVTFTIKSAREMKERLARLVGDAVVAKLVLGTFHSVCRRYLVRYGHHIGLRRGFGIADSSDSLSAVKRIVKRLQLTIDPATAKNRISKAKARIAGYDELRNEAKKGSKARADQADFLLVFEEYEAYLSTCNLLDYDDLLLRCVDLLRRRPDCVSNVEAVLVDEFQDTNSVQFDLMRLFASARNRITTVGDPDQSIYGWRSAEVENLLKMQRLWPETLVLNLEDNYRSSGAILAAALDVIEQDDSRPPKPLQPTHCRGSQPVYRKLPSSHAQASWTVAEIQRCIKLSCGLLNPSDFAILLRSASISRQIESCMGQAGLPYRMVGGARFFDRVEIKILLNYLRVIAHPHNNEAFSAILNVPSRRIGENSLKSLMEEAIAKRISLFDLAHGFVQKRISITTKILKAGEQGLAHLVSIVLTGRKKLADEADFYPDQVLAYIIKKLDFQEYLRRMYPEDEDGRWSNVQEFMAQASGSVQANDPAEEEDILPSIEGVEQGQLAHPAEEALTKFLANVALSTELQRDDEGDSAQGRVTISTIHAAKGLEWPIVFVPSVYDGMMPHSRAEDCDEERRLLYVAMTRAQAMLYISIPRRSATSGEDTEQSQFITDKLLDQRFADKGPTLDFCDIDAIATILGREAPLEEVLNCTRLDSEQVEDDLWPTNGEEWPAGYWDNVESEREHGYSSKRQRLEGGRGSAQSISTSSASYSSYRQTTSLTSTGFPSTVPSVGFTTASVHMVTTQANLPVTSSKYGEQKLMHVKTTTIKTSPKAGRGGQSTLKSFWGQPASNCPDGTSTQDAEKQGSELLPPLVATHNRFSPCPDDGEPRGVGLTQAKGAAATEIGQPSVKPHSVSREGLKRPRVLADPESAAPYVFLSSSPPRPLHIGESERPDDCTNKAHGSLQSGARPAATLHNTSMGQMQGGGTSGNQKTLGLKRSTGQWNGGGMRPFRPPTMSGKGRAGPGA